MVGRGENHFAILIQIIIFWKQHGTAGASQPKDFCQDGVGIIQGGRNSRDRLKARAANTCRLDPFGRQAIKYVSRHDNLVAPAKALIKMPFGYPALIVFAA
jgi:hypothetical protein